MPVVEYAARGGVWVPLSGAGSITPPPPPIIQGGAVTHGQQLTINHVGPWTLQGVAKGAESLSVLTSAQVLEKLGTWPTDGRPSWIPGTDYVYNNAPSNHGGVVPSGGMTIDGYTVAAGTWVVQFRDFANGGLIIEGDDSGTAQGAGGASFPGVLFRGCRMRNPWSAPGFFNQNGQRTDGKIWFLYCDAGGKSLATADYCESIFESQHNGNYQDGTDKMYVIRCYLSNATTLVYSRNSGDAVIECYGENVSDYGDTTKHLNGFANGGGENATLWLRNHIVLNQPSGSTQPLSDVIQMAADGGAYLGTATNLDGSTGYIFKDNYLGGAGGHDLQLGYDKTNTITQVRNVKVTGNKFTESSGQVAYKTPDFTQYGNTWSGNSYSTAFAADAPAASNV